MPGIGGPLIVHRGHPLLRDAVSWWLALPRTMGGPRLVDLLGRYSGTVGGAALWRGSFWRVGGYGSLLFNGSTDYVDLPTTAAFDGLSGTKPFTISAWAQVNNLGGYGGVFYVGDRDVVVDVSEADGAWRFVIHSDTAGFLAIPSDAAPTTGVPYHLVAVCTGALTTLYVNGKAQTTTQTTPDGVTAHVGAVPVIGAWNLSGTYSRFLNGRVDDVLIVSGRAWSAAEVRQWYDLSRSGYPGLLMRRSAAVKTTTAVPVGAKIIFRNVAHV